MPVPSSSRHDRACKNRRSHDSESSESSMLRYVTRAARLVIVLDPDLTFASHHAPPIALHYTHKVHFCSFSAIAVMLQEDHH